LYLSLRAFEGEKLTGEYMMKNLVRGGFILSLIGVFVLFVYASDRTGGDLSIANNSQVQLDQILENTQQNNNDDKDKKLVKKTVLESPVPAAEAATTATKSAALNKGSFTATAYCLKGRTAMGHGVRRGIVAADPRFLRLGSRINLGAGAYSGQYLVSDTGGGIKGRRIDIWVPSCAEARRFGRRTIQVGLLGSN
jgi:3D (Asp-Asp-Asp) domain-containing protein